MIIYNITIQIDVSIETEWLSWLKKEYITAILNTGCFTAANILQILETGDAEHFTYAIQFHADSKALYNLYIEKYANSMLQKSFGKWGDQFVSFSTVMQVVN
jgi:hypothetical protein